jgi:hypothetical protein
MAVVIPEGYEQQLRQAVSFYWKTLREQGEKQAKGEKPDTGVRGEVTGGKHMRKLCELVNDLLSVNGMPDGHVYVDNKLELPGWYRPTK